MVAQLLVGQNDLLLMFVLSQKVSEFQPKKTKNSKNNVTKTVQFIKRRKGDISPTENSKDQIRAEASRYFLEPPLHDDPFRLGYSLNVQSIALTLFRRIIDL